MRTIRTPFIAVPVWVYASADVTPTVMQVYLALAERSLVERKPPRGVGWVQRASGLGRTAVYDALNVLRRIGAIVDVDDDLFLPTDPPSATADSASAPADTSSAPTDESSATADRAFLIENLERAESSSSPAGDTKDPDLGFDHFWNEWPRRNGKKLFRGKALTAWRRLSYDERKAAYRGAKHYAAASNAGLAGAMDAFRWLAARAWDDWQTPAEQPAVNGNGRGATRQRGFDLLRDRLETTVRS